MLRSNIRGSITRPCNRIIPTPLVYLHVDTLYHKFMDSFNKRRLLCLFTLIASIILSMLI